MKKANMSFLHHSARQRGWTLTVNLNPPGSFVSTVPTGTQAETGEIWSCIYLGYCTCKWPKYDNNITFRKTYLKVQNQSCEQFNTWLCLIIFSSRHIKLKIPLQQTCWLWTHTTATKGAVWFSSELFHEQNDGAHLRKTTSGNWFRYAITCEVASLRYINFKTILTGP